MRRATPPLSDSVRTEQDAHSSQQVGRPMYSSLQSRGPQKGCIWGKLVLLASCHQPEQPMQVRPNPTCLLPAGAPQHAENYLICSSDAPGANSLQGFLWATGWLKANSTIQNLPSKTQMLGTSCPQYLTVHGSPLLKS